MSDDDATPPPEDFLRQEGPVPATTLGADALSALRSALADRYRIERELGGGGMSRVFLSREVALDREVVVKVIAPELLEGASAGRFAREVKLAARLQQANIVPVLSAGEAGGVPYYTMPFVRGESLRARFARGEVIPLPQAIGILRDVARALEYAHGEEVVHRDIKPENILLSGSTAVVTDFGVAKALATARTGDGTGIGTLTKAGSTTGTPAYMAPEQIAGGEVDRRTDLYAWGVVAWELFAGHHPFSTAATAHAIMAAHLAQTPPELGTVRADVPTSLANLVRRCLEKDPDLRPASAREVLAALDDVATPRAVTVPPPATPQAGTRRRVALGAAAALGVVAIVLGTVWRLGRSPPSTAAAPAKSIAVLPCESVGGDTANVYFAEGMADELTTALTTVEGLRVAATSSAFTYRGKTADPREVGRALNVGTVLQCKVRRAGSVLRLSAQLTNAADGLLLWSRSYDREAKDVFAVQDELAREIAGALRITLAGGASVAASQGTRDVEAYDLYLRGRYFLRQRGPGVAKSIPYFRQAIARDSMFARAWAQLGTAYGLLVLYDHVARDTTLREARAAIRRALVVDSLGAEARAASGLVFAMGNQWARAWAAYQRAMQLDPNDADTYRFALATLSTLGREADAMEAIRVLMERDPLSGLTSGVIAMTQLDFGHREDALASARRAVELDSSAALPHAILAMAELVAGQRDSARTLARTTRHTPNTTPWIGWVLGATDRQAAADLVREVEGLRGRYASVDITRAFVALGARDTTAALDALERAARSGEPIGWMAAFGMPAYDPIRKSARFTAVVRAFGADPASFTKPTGGHP